MTNLSTLNPDFRDMLLALLAARAEFLIVGAYAVSFHGHPRTTGDFDILVNPTPENAQRVWSALQQFGAPLTSIGLRREDLVNPDTVCQVGVPPRRIDLLTSISGVDFAAAWQSRVEAEWQGHRVGFLGLEALLANKRAAGRPKDLDDIRALQRRPRPKG